MNNTKQRMKKFSYPILLFLAFSLMIAPTITAQKIGYISSQAILAEMPEVQQMNSILKTFQSQLQKQGQGMVERYKQKEENAIKKKERGELSPIEEQTVLEELQKEQEDILSFEKEMQQKLADKEQELLKPIYDKVNNAIAAVAKENGFKMILEAGVLLYAEEELDTSHLVKAKLGM